MSSARLPNEAGSPAPPPEVVVSRADVIAVLVLLAFAVVMAAPSFADKVPLFRDIPGFTLPSRWLWREAIADGRLPEWNATVGLGVPMLAAPVHGTLYPGHVLLLLSPFPLAFGVTWLLHAFWGAVGAYGIARTLGTRPSAAFVAGVVWIFGGYFVSMWCNGEKVLSDAWLSWYALSLLRWCADETRFRSPWGALAGLSLAMVALAGDPFLWLHAMLLATPLLLARVSSIRTAATALSRTVASVVLGALLAAPSLVPTLTLRGDTARAEALTREVAERWSMHPARIWEILLPGALGNPLDLTHYPGGMWADDPTVQALPWAISLYAGAALVCLALQARWSRIVAFLAAGVALSVLLSLGRHTPIHALARALLPPLGLFRYPEKHVVVAMALVALCGALGAERVLDRGPRSALWVAWPNMAFIAVGLVFAPTVLTPHVRVGALHALAATFAVAGSLYLLPRRALPDAGPTRAGESTGSDAANAIHARRAAIIGPLLAGIVSLDLATAALPLLPWREAPWLVEAPPALRPVSSPAPLPIARVHSVAEDHLDIRSLPGSSGALFRIATLPGHDPARSERLRRLWNAVQEPERLSVLTGLSGLLVPSPPGALGKPTWTVHALGKWARSWPVTDVFVADSEEGAIERLAQPDFDPRTSAVVVAGGDSGAGRDFEQASPHQGPPGRCKTRAERPETLSVQCTIAATRALVVIAESFALGWTAELDGVAAPIVPVNLALRGVWVPAGEHTIVMKYRTPGLRLGAAFGAVGAVCALALASGRSRRRPTA